MGKDLSVNVVAKEASDALADLARRDLTGLTDAEIEEHAVATAELLRLAEAAHVSAMARLDTSGAWAPSGARSAAHYVGWKGHLPLPRAQALQRGARRLRNLPATANAFVEGRITVDHVGLLAHAQSKAPEAFAHDEARLVEVAASRLFSESRPSSATGSAVTTRTVSRPRPHRSMPSGASTAPPPSKAPWRWMPCSTP